MSESLGTGGLLSALGGIGSTRNPAPRMSESAAMVSTGDGKTFSGSNDNSPAMTTTKRIRRASRRSNDLNPASKNGNLNSGLSAIADATLKSNINTGKKIDGSMLKIMDAFATMSNKIEKTINKQAAMLEKNTTAIISRLESIDKHILLLNETFKQAFDSNLKAYSKANDPIPRISRFAEIFAPEFARREAQLIKEFLTPTTTRVLMETFLQYTSKNSTFRKIFGYESMKLSRDTRTVPFNVELANTLKKTIPEALKTINDSISVINSNNRRESGMMVAYSRAFINFSNTTRELLTNINTGIRDLAVVLTTKISEFHRDYRIVNNAQYNHNRGNIAIEEVQRRQGLAHVRGTAEHRELERDLNTARMQHIRDRSNSVLEGIALRTLRQLAPPGVTVNLNDLGRAELVSILANPNMDDAEKRMEIQNRFLGGVSRNSISPQRFRAISRTMHQFSQTINQVNAIAARQDPDNPDATSTALIPLINQNRTLALPNAAQRAVVQHFNATLRQNYLTEGTRAERLRRQNQALEERFEIGNFQETTHRLRVFGNNRLPEGEREREEFRERAQEAENRSLQAMNEFRDTVGDLHRGFEAYTGAVNTNTSSLERVVTGMEVVKTSLYYLFDYNKIFKFGMKLLKWAGIYRLADTIVGGLYNLFDADWFKSMKGTFSKYLWSPLKDYLIVPIARSIKSGLISVFGEEFVNKSISVFDTIIEFGKTGFNALFGKTDVERLKSRRLIMEPIKDAFTYVVKDLLLPGIQKIALMYVGWNTAKRKARDAWNWIRTPTDPWLIRNGQYVNDGPTSRVRRWFANATHTDRRVDQASGLALRPRAFTAQNRRGQYYNTGRMASIGRGLSRVGTGLSWVGRGLGIGFNVLSVGYMTSVLFSGIKKIVDKSEADPKNKTSVIAAVSTFVKDMFKSIHKNVFGGMGMKDIVSIFVNGMIGILKGTWETISDIVVNTDWGDVIGTLLDGLGSIVGSLVNWAGDKIWKMFHSEEDLTDEILRNSFAEFLRKEASTSKDSNHGSLLKDFEFLSKQDKSELIKAIAESKADNSEWSIIKFINTIGPKYAGKLLYNDNLNNPVINRIAGIDKSLSTIAKELMNNYVSQKTYEEFAKENREWAKEMAARGASSYDTIQAFQERKNYEDDARRKREEADKKEAEARKKEEEARKKEEGAQRKESEGAADSISSKLNSIYDFFTGSEFWNKATEISTKIGDTIGSIFDKIKSFDLQESLTKVNTGLGSMFGSLLGGLFGEDRAGRFLGIFQKVASENGFSGLANFAKSARVSLYSKVTDLVSYASRNNLDIAEIRKLLTEAKEQGWDLGNASITALQSDESIKIESELRKSATGSRKEAIDKLGSEEKYAEEIGKYNIGHKNKNSSMKVAARGTILSSDIPQAHISSHFGERRKFKTSSGQLVDDVHDGIDIGSTSATAPSIFAAYEGKIARADNADPNGYGNLVAIHHTIGGKPYTTIYAHLEKFADGIAGSKKEVKAGEAIGVMGNTGKSSGRHLHFGVYTGHLTSFGSKASSKAINPIPFLEMIANGSLIHSISDVTQIPNADAVVGGALSSTATEPTTKLPIEKAALGKRTYVALSSLNGQKAKEFFNKLREHSKTPTAKDLQNNATSESLAEIGENTKQQVEAIEESNKKSPTSGTTIINNITNYQRDLLNMWYSEKEIAEMQRTNPEQLSLLLQSVAGGF